MSHPEFFGDDFFGKRIGIRRGILSKFSDMENQSWVWNPLGFGSLKIDSKC